jgi:hypothetical protein
MSVETACRGLERARHTDSVATTRYPEVLGFPAVFGGLAIWPLDESTVRLIPWGLRICSARSGPDLADRSDMKVGSMVKVTSGFAAFVRVS